MANVRSGNTFYIDTQYSGASDELAIKNIKVTYITMSATSANAILVLGDSSTGTKKIDMRIPTSGDSKIYWFENNQLVFPNGIRPLTLTNAIATVVVEESRG